MKIEGTNDFRGYVNTQLELLDTGKMGANISNAKANLLGKMLKSVEIDIMVFKLRASTPEFKLNTVLLKRLPAKKIKQAK